MSEIVKWFENMGYTVLPLEYPARGFTVNPDPGPELMAKAEANFEEVMTALTVSCCDQILCHAVWFIPAISKKYPELESQFNAAVDRVLTNEHNQEDPHAFWKAALIYHYLVLSVVSFGDGCKCKPNCLN